MRYFLIAFFVLIFWFCLGSWIYVCKIKNRCGENIDAKIKRTEFLDKKNAAATIKYNEKEQKPPLPENKKTETPVENKILYFDVNSKEHEEDVELQNYITRLKRYVSEHPDKKVTIIGHTDNIGETEANEWIAMQRAENLMNYMILQGISKEKITVFSKGETQPIASNGTRKGRQQNRRTEIKIN
jgi:outer membrane protein OmpA-like peptidoglycan-associated protein